MERKKVLLNDLFNLLNFWVFRILFTLDLCVIKTHTAVSSRYCGLILTVYHLFNLKTVPLLTRSVMGISAQLNQLLHKYGLVVEWVLNEADWFRMVDNVIQVVLSRSALRCCHTVRVLAISISIASYYKQYRSAANPTIRILTLEAT